MIKYKVKNLYWPVVIFFNHDKYRFVFNFSDDFVYEYQMVGVLLNDDPKIGEMERVYCTNNFKALLLKGKND